MEEDAHCKSEECVRSQKVVSETIVSHLFPQYRYFCQSFFLRMKCFYRTEGCYGAWSSWEEDGIANGWREDPYAEGEEDCLKRRPEVWERTCDTCPGSARTAWSSSSHEAEPAWKKLNKGEREKENLSHLFFGAGIVTGFLFFVVLSVSSPLLFRSLIPRPSRSSGRRRQEVIEEAVVSLF